MFFQSYVAHKGTEFFRESDVISCKVVRPFILNGIFNIDMLTVRLYLITLRLRVKLKKSNSRDKKDVHPNMRDMHRLSMTAQGQGRESVERHARCSCCFSTVVFYQPGFWHRDHLSFILTKWVSNGLAEQVPLFFTDFPGGGFSTRMVLSELVRDTFLGELVSEFCSACSVIYSRFQAFFCSNSRSGCFFFYNLTHKLSPFNFRIYVIPIFPNSMQNGATFFHTLLSFLRYGILTNESRPGHRRRPSIIVFDCLPVLGVER